LVVKVIRQSNDIFLPSADSRLGCRWLTVKPSISKRFWYLGHSVNTGVWPDAMRVDAPKWVLTRQCTSYGKNLFSREKCRVQDKCAEPSEV
ncbi:MAG: hypothetical protein AAFZ14_03200, partial [Pseudomonadota bacterium]